MKNLFSLVALAIILVSGCKKGNDLSPNEIKYQDTESLITSLNSDADGIFLISAVTDSRTRELNYRASGSVSNRDNANSLADVGSFSVGSHLMKPTNIQGTNNVYLLSGENANTLSDLYNTNQVPVAINNSTSKVLDTQVPYSPAVIALPNIINPNLSMTLNDAITWNADVNNAYVGIEFSQFIPGNARSTYLIVPDNGSYSLSAAAASIPWLTDKPVIITLYRGGVRNAVGSDNRKYKTVIYSTTFFVARISQ